MTDIVERLTALANEWHECCGDIHEPLAEAAEEIRNLRHTCDGLLAERDMAREALGRIMECYVDFDPNDHTYTELRYLYEAFGEAYDIADAALRSHEAQQ